jgi:hypothetical protein
MVTVRWCDGYMETFVVTEARASGELLWMRLLSGDSRNIPLRGVRWYSLCEMDSLDEYRSRPHLATGSTAKERHGG